ncbi:MAG TPA: hypothetical protein VHX15_15855 [Frankiaceae bacterium]|nr:hypothetical protein [Frankiaceae bacterium]
MTLAPTPPAGFGLDAAYDATCDAIPAPTSPAARGSRTAWWQWLDFDSETLAQVWVICCTQILVLVIAGLVIHASAASPY